jgi:hypothetical protein
VGFRVLQKNAVDAADKVETVRTQLLDTQSATHRQLQNIQRTSDDTHVLVNNNMAIQLKISAMALRRVADLTKEEGDQAAAQEAEKSLTEHLGKQAHVDEAIKLRNRAE